MSIDSLLGSDLGRSLIDRTREVLDELSQSIARELNEHGISDDATEEEGVFLRLLDQATTNSDRDPPQSTDDTATDLPATETAPIVKLDAGLQTSDTNNGMLHVHRISGSVLPWDGNGLNTAVKSYLDAALVPDATGMMGGQVAPGLEGWNELVQNSEDGRYHGYRDYLENNYPGGYDAWNLAFDTYRRVSLNGESLEFSIANTSGLRDGIGNLA